VVFGRCGNDGVGLGVRNGRPDPAPAVEQIGDVQTVTPSEVEGKPSDVGGFSSAACTRRWCTSPSRGWWASPFIDFFGLVAQTRKSGSVWAFSCWPGRCSASYPPPPPACCGPRTCRRMRRHTPCWSHTELSNFAVAGLVLAAFALRLWRRNSLAGRWRISYLVLLFAATGMVLLAADFGGRMVYGPDYLPW